MERVQELLHHSVSPEVLRLYLLEPGNVHQAAAPHVGLAGVDQLSEDNNLARETLYYNHL